MISIIIPVYNAENTICQCLDSLEQNKDIRQCEIIVVDNGSTDSTNKLVQKRDLIYVNEERPSVYSARNKGASIAKYDILAFLDSDCTVDSEWISNGVRWIFDFDMVVPRIMPKPSEKNNKLLYLYDYIMANELPKYIFSSFWNANFFIKKRHFVETGGFREGIISAGDVIFGEEMKKRGYRVIFPGNLFVYHPVDSLRKRLQRSVREGNGGLVKYKIKAQSETHRAVIGKIIKNFVQLLRIKLRVTTFYAKSHCINYSSRFGLYSIVLFFHILGYSQSFLAIPFRLFSINRISRY
jgi:glycosyltransferase AglI